MAGKKKGVTLLFDNREKDEELKKYLERFGAYLHVGNFEIGDIGVAGRVNFAIEHKSVNDLASSLVSMIPRNKPITTACSNKSLVQAESVCLLES